MAFWNNGKNEYDLFTQIKDLRISSLSKGIKPTERFRNTSDSMIRVFNNENINSKKLKRLFDIYGDEIVLEYLNDIELKNKSNLKKSGYILIEDHVKIYSEEELKDIINRFISKEEIKENEKYVLMGLIQKCCELIDTYKYSNLIRYPEYIKKELKLGIFEDIVVKGKKYTNAERKKFVKLSDKWDRNTFARYRNLELLEQRLLNLPKNKQVQSYIDKIEQIIKMDIDNTIVHQEKIKADITDVFLFYEIKNRENIIDKLYNPENKKQIVIDDLSKLGNGSMLHFFGPYSKVFSLNTYYKKLEKTYKRELTPDEKEMARRKFEVMSNNYIVNQSVPMTAIGQTNEMHKYLIDTSNQLSCMFITAKDIFKMKGVRGSLALGFSKKTLKPEQIVTISSKNIYSNKNIENVEVHDDFEEFSVTFEELKNKEKSEQNTEVVMFRNTDITTLKPSYVMYIAYEDINSEHEKENIKTYKDQMKEAGIDVPFVIFDQYTILKKLEKEKGIER